MVHYMGEANREWAKLAPPPRLAPSRFRWRWLVHLIWVLVGSCIFGGGCLASLPFSLNTDPVGTLRLALARREAPGRLEKVEDTGMAGGDGMPTIFRHTYTFRLPDGTP